mgnify:CR=1 FL=1
MRMPVILSVAALALGAPSAAQTGRNADAATDAKLAKALAGLTRGETRGCLPLTGRQQYRTEGYGRTILYRVGRNQVYRTETSGGCERIARGDALIVRQPGAQLCAGDIATTADLVSRFPTGSCSFGPFTEYRRR